ncbi:unnamed protein product [Dicrocoelium dendriticum]|nr:unnamed protein product [Dicrocoelium dendriticum]
MPEDKTKLLVEQQRQEILSLKTELAARETRLNDLTSLLDKYQSVFSRQTHLISAFRNGFEDDVMTGQNHQIPSTYPRRRGIGISAEPEDTETIVTTELRRYAKPEDVRKLIKQAIIENDFLSHLAQEELRDIIDCMQPIASKAGDVLIAEGETGSMVYVLFDGRLEIWKNGTKIREINKCTVLGELAILYNCQRTATVKGKFNFSGRHTFHC